MQKLLCLSFFIFSTLALAMHEPVLLPHPDILKERIDKCIFHCPDFEASTGLSASLGDQRLSADEISSQVNSAIHNFATLKNATSVGRACLLSFKPELIRHILLEHPAVHAEMMNPHERPVLIDDEA